MKIAIITPFFYPHIGGMERSLFNLANLINENNSIIIYTTKHGILKDDCKFKVIRHQSNSLNTWSGSIIEFLKTYGPFEAIIYGGIGKDVLKGVLESAEFSKQSKSRSFLRIPTSDHIKRHLGGLNAQEILQKFDHFVCIDRLAQEELVNSFKIKKVHYIPNGVDSNIYSPIETFTSRASTILYSGRIARRKNVDIIVKLAKIFKREFNFIIQGSPSYGEQDYYSEIIDSFKELENVELVETSWDNHKIYQRAGVFLLPSNVEGCSNSLLEAMSCELYCFASNIVENKIIVANYGTLFEINLEEIENKLRKYLSSIDSKSELVHNGRLHIIKNFSIEKTVKSWNKILNENV